MLSLFSLTTLALAWEAPCTTKCLHPPTSVDGDEEAAFVGEGEDEDLVVPTTVAT